MRISDWSSDVCSSDLTLSTVSAAPAANTGPYTPNNAAVSTVTLIAFPCLCALPIRLPLLLIRPLSATKDVNTFGASRGLYRHLVCSGHSRGETTAACLAKGQNGLFERGNTDAGTG